MTDTDAPGHRDPAADDAPRRPPRRAVCVGSFDPIHRGHLDIIGRAARLVDEVIVAVADNPSKQHLFDQDRRMQLAREALADVPQAVVEPLGQGLLAHYVRDRAAVAVVKGLRSGRDFDYEMPMEAMNRALAGTETIFLAAAPGLAHLSSSLIKEVHALGGDVSAMVPEAVLRALGPAQDG